MSTHSAYNGFGLPWLRATTRLPQPLATLASARPNDTAAPTDWLERLAMWAERQPVHRRMGSYTQRR